MGSLPLEAVPDAGEAGGGGGRGKRVSKSGVGAERADREKSVKITTNWEKGIQITMIRVQGVGLYRMSQKKLQSDFPHQ